jgi:hypothetical protein
MLRQPHDLEVQWDIHGHRVTTGPHHHLGWLIALLVMLARFLIGLEVRDTLIWRHQQ